jgi:hypothetical protein
VDRRRAVIGYITFMLARRLARRALRRRVERLKAVRPPRGRKGVITLAVVGAGAAAAALGTRLVGARRDHDEP